MRDLHGTGVSRSSAFGVVLLVPALPSAGVRGSGIFKEYHYDALVALSIGRAQMSFVVVVRHTSIIS
jgi:hypothetical protein